MTVKEFFEMVEYGTNVRICNANCTKCLYTIYDFDDEEDFIPDEFCNRKIVGFGDSVDNDIDNDNDIYFMEIWTK